MMTFYRISLSGAGNKFVPALKDRVNYYLDIASYQFSQLPPAEPEA